MNIAAVRSRIAPATQVQWRVQAGGVLRPELVVLATAVVFALARRGAYDGHDFAIVEVLVGLAVTLALATRAVHVAAFRHPAVAGAALVGLSTLVSGLFAGEVRSAAPTFGILACGAAVVVLVASAPPEQRDLLVSLLLSVGALVALTGWWGVAAHHDPWGLIDGGLWRAASTLTYANATAALLGPLVLLLVARLITVEAGRRRSMAAWSALGAVLLVGCAATLSRAGIVALLGGWVVLAGSCGWRPTWRATCAPVAGAAVGASALLPSFAATRHGLATAGHPSAAVVMMIAGAAVAGVTAWCLDRFDVAAPAASVVAVALLLLGVAASTHGGVGAVTADRVSVASPDRNREWASTWRLAADHPLVGVGPGPFATSWRSGDGTVMTAEYTHNEYLQLAAQQGVVGIAAGIAALFPLVRAIAKRPPRQRSSIRSRAIRAGPLAGLVALALHSGFDFLWHIPVLPLLGAILAGAALSLKEPT